MLVKTDVIVPQIEPSEWCTGAHFVDKHNGKVRLVNNLTALNTYTKRPMSMARSAVTPAATDTPGRTQRWRPYSKPRRMTHTGWWYRLYAKEENGKIYPLTIPPVSKERSGINLPSSTKTMTRFWW